MKVGAPTPIKTTRTPLSITLKEKPQEEQFMARFNPDRLNFFALPEGSMKKASTQGKYFCWQSDQSMLTSLFLTIHWSVWVWSLVLKAGSWGSRSSEPALLCSPERDYILARSLCCFGITVLLIEGATYWFTSQHFWLPQLTSRAGQANSLLCWESEETAPEYRR